MQVRSAVEPCIDMIKYTAEQKKIFVRFESEDDPL